MSGVSETGRNGVAFLVNKKCTKYVESYKVINDKEYHLTLNQLNSILSRYLCQELIIHEAEYEKLKGVISNIPQKDLLIVTGDFNAKIGNTKNDDHIRKIVGK